MNSIEVVRTARTKPQDTRVAMLAATKPTGTENVVFIGHWR